MSNLPFCPTSGCPGTLKRCQAPGCDDAFECTHCNALFEIERDGLGSTNFAQIPTAHHVTLAEIADEPELVSLGEWERPSELADDAGDAFTVKMPQLVRGAHPRPAADICLAQAACRAFDERPLDEALDAPQGLAADDFDPLERP